MPGTFSSIDSGFPAFSGGESLERKVAALYDYTFLLLENLHYILRNLGPENLNEADTLDWIGRNIQANTIVSNTVITNELYSEFGAIADLVVDELRTDYQKAQRYLNGNTGALDYLHIHDEEIDYITGTVKLGTGDVPLTEQLHHGTRYFWWTDAGMTQMTSTEQTAWPVTVYQYDELVKSSYRFEELTSGGVTVKVPVMIFGAGLGNAQDPDRGKGFLRKNTDSFDLWLTNSQGQQRGIFIGDSYTDLVGLRKTTELDFSGWDNGSFTETLDGNLTETYSVTFDTNGYPVKITDGSGHETEVVW